MSTSLCMPILCVRKGYLTQKIHEQNEFSHKVATKTDLRDEHWVLLASVEKKKTRSHTVTKSDVDPLSLDFTIANHEHWFNNKNYHYFG